jgi:Prokaryotic E2 family E
MLPPQLASELELLKAQYRIETIEEPSTINVVLRGYPTSSLYSSPQTNLLLRVPKSYPDAGLDMFWTDTELVLQDKTVPKNADLLERYPALEVIPDFAGKKWRRFSWHPQRNGPLRWNPAVDNIESYLEFVNRRFRER